MTAALELPPGLAALEGLVGSVPSEDLGRHAIPATGGRASAVLVDFTMGPDGPEVLLLKRAERMRRHPGQVAFPGGSVDDGETLVECALRETLEETGIDPVGVAVLGTLPARYLPPSGFVVTPVLGWEPTPADLVAGHPDEVASVHRVPVRDLVDPAARLRVRHPASGYVGPAFRVQGLLVWGFTGTLLASLLRQAAWEQPWDEQAEPIDAPAGRGGPSS